MRTPKFWYIDDRFVDWLASLVLWPFSFIYYALSKEFSKRTNPYRASVPVICVGNIVAGGAGKTPSTMAIADLLKNNGYNPHIISRGYGGNNKEPLKVDATKHNADLVGDEPLMMAQKGYNVWVSAKRRKTAYLATQAGANVILMDDGFQNQDLIKDCSVLVVDGLMGFGNEKMIPAGPLREPIEVGMARANIVLFIDEDLTGAERYMANKPIITADFVPKTTEFEGKDVYPFAGMGRPEKFLRTLFKMGANIVGFEGYPDHYYYRDLDIKNTLRNAKMKNAIPVTTVKDWMRIDDKFKADIKTVDVDLVIHDEEALLKLLKPHLDKKIVKPNKGKKA